ncbi:hypothetical protein [Yoonia sp.]|uniref:hypothetical protein n=1 Tax=Yoonia sp. TaxID=2212373 RepID=UPI003976FBD1
MANSSTSFWLMWMVVCLVVASASSYLAYGDPLRYVGIIDLLASIISILVGVSLAVTAVLASPFSVSVDKAKDEFEAERITKVVSSDDQILASGQLLLFIFFLLALIFALACKWLVNGQSEPLPASSHIVSAVSAFTAIFSLLWSIRLPFMLNALAQQRSRLG